MADNKNRTDRRNRYQASFSLTLRSLVAGVSPTVRAAVYYRG